MQEIISYYTSYWGVVELLATAFTLINVYLLTKQSQWNYLFGFVGVVLFGYLFWEFNLLADVGLQWLFYAPLQIYGWYYWQTKGSSGPNSLIPVYMGPVNFFKVVGATAILTGVLGYAMGKMGSDFAIADSYVAAASIVASALMLRKYIEAWIVWISVDLVAIPVYFLKDLHVTAVLYVLFLCLCVRGFMEWMRAEEASRYVEPDCDEEAYLGWADYREEEVIEN